MGIVREVTDGEGVVETVLYHLDCRFGFLGHRRDLRRWRGLVRLGWRLRGVLLLEGGGRIWLGRVVECRLER